MATREERTAPLASPSPPIASGDRTDPVVSVTEAAAAPRRPSIPGYEILGELGRGGMGVVYKARQIELQRLVALKMIVAGAHASPEQRSRFLAEARAVARLHHPNIVQIFDVGEIDGCPYFALEYVGGGNLAEKLDGTPMPPRQVAALVSTLAGAMQSAHEQSIVHRDLKPANVLLTEKGMPKITDFGLAKELGEQEGQTRSGAILGTPSYMAPEQVLGKSAEIAPHTDVYALGAILYEMLTGRPPLRGETPMDTMMLSVSQEPVPPAQLQPKVPRDLELICLKCLSKEPRKRLSSAAQLAVELRHFLKNEPLEYTRPVGRAERTWRWCRRNPLVAVLMLAFVGSLMLGTLLSSYGAIRAYLSAQRAERLKEEAERASARADAKATEAEVNAQRAESERFEAQLMAAGLALNRGQELCEKGDVSRGMLWMVQSLRLIPPAPADAAAKARTATLERVIRANLSGWRPELNPVRAILEHGGWVNAASFSNDGRLVVTASDDRTARIWDARTGAPIGSPIPHPSYVSQARFIPDGSRLVLVGWDGTARIWDVQTRKPVGEAIAHPTKILLIAIPRGGRFVATGSVNGTVHLIDTSDGSKIGETIEHRGLSCLAFSPDGLTLATGGLDGAVRFWDRQTGKPRGAVLEQKIALMSLAYHPEGKILLTGGVDGIGRFWNVAGNTPVTVPSLQHQSWIVAIAFSPDGKRVVTGSHDFTARVWDVQTGQMLGVPLRHHGAVRSVAFSPDGRVVATGSADSSARLWLASLGQPLGAWLTHQGEVVSVAFHPDGQSVLTSSHDKTARLWQLDALKPRKLLAAESVVNGIGFSPDGAHMVAACAQKSPKLWQIKGTVKQELLENLSPSVSASFGSRNRFVTAHYVDARIWEVGKSQPVHILPHPRTVYTAAFSADARIVATGCEDSNVRFFDAASGKPHDKMINHPDIVYALAFSHDGKLLATGCEDGMVRLWQTSDWRAVGEPLRHPGGVRSVAFSRDGRILVSGCVDGAVRSWDTSTGKPAGPALLHHGEVFSVAVTGDGDTVVAGSGDGTARVWDRVSGKQLGRPFVHYAAVNAVAIHPDGRLAASGGRDQIAYFWPLPRSVDGNLERLTLWVEGLTAMSLNEEGATQPLRARDWHERRKAFQSSAREP